MAYKKLHKTLVAHNARSSRNVPASRNNQRVIRPIRPTLPLQRVPLKNQPVRDHHDNLWQKQITIIDKVNRIKELVAQIQSDVVCNMPPITADKKYLKHCHITKKNLDILQRHIALHKTQIANLIAEQETLAPSPKRTPNT